MTKVNFSWLIPFGFITATSVTADELAAKYGNLKFSRDEQVSVYAKNEYYSIKPAVGVED